METYSELKRRQQEEFNALPIGAAFSNNQFSEMLKEWGIREKDAKNQVVSIGAGCFIRKADIPAYTRTVRRHKKELKEAIEADQTGEGFIYQMFYEEMANHEFGYTGDPEDTLNACGYTYKQVAEDQRISAGWKMAEQKFIK